MFLTKEKYRVACATYFFKYVQFSGYRIYVNNENEFIRVWLMALCFLDIVKRDVNELTVLIINKNNSNCLHLKFNDISHLVV